jgi:hypothetical protein
MSKDIWTPTGDKEYPLKTTFSIPAEELPTLTGISPRLPKGVNTLDIDVWTGTEETGFYERIKPPRKKPQGEPYTPDRYREELSTKGVPLPPEQWETERVIYTRNMDLLSTVQFPKGEVGQGRIINTFQPEPPLPPQGVLFIPAITSIEYFNELVDAGFRRERRTGLASGLETVARTALGGLRAIGFPTRPTGQLEVVTRKRNRRAVSQQRR